MAGATESATAGGMSDQQTTVAIVFGAVLTLVGIIGFAGVLVNGDGEILGLFGITPLHNAVHLLTGLLGLAAGFVAGGEYGNDYNKYLGAIYLVVFLVGVLGVLLGIGIVTGDSGFLALNIGWPDNVLHLLIGVVLAAVGFGMNQ